MHGRRIYHARGKVLGGSSSINGMIFQRGNPLDYERWAAEPGLEQWDYAHCLPYFKRMETCLAGADEWRGGDGPLVLERGPAEGPLFDAFFDAVQEAGYPLTERRQRLPAGGLREVRPQHPPRPPPERGARVPAPGARRARTSRCARARSSSASSSRGRARSACRSNGETIRAGEVILCGGAINSPQLLQLSGVGERRASSRRSACRRRPRPAGRRREPAGPSRGLRPVRVDAAGDRCARTTEWRNRPLVGAEVAALQVGPGRDEPLRGRRVHPLERRRRLSERDVPLPADRRPLRRHGAAGARLPAARRARCTPTRAAR